MCPAFTTISATNPVTKKVPIAAGGDICIKQSNFFLQYLTLSSF